MDSSSSVLLENTCRVCLISNPYSIYHDINKHSPKLGKIIAVAIMECATVKIKLNDDFPDQICEKCYNQLVYAQEFKKACIASDLKQTCSNVSSNKSQSLPVVGNVVRTGVISDKRRLTSDNRTKDIDSHKTIERGTIRQTDYPRQSGITNANQHPESSNIGHRNDMIPAKFPRLSSLDQKKQFVPFHIQEKNNSRQSNTDSTNNRSGNLASLDPPIIRTMDQRKEFVRNSVPFDSQEKKRPHHSIETDDDDLVPPDPPIISKAEQKSEVQNYYRNFVPSTTRDSVPSKNPETNFPSTVPVEPTKVNCQCLKCGKFFANPDETRIHMNCCELPCECGKTFKKVSVYFHHRRVTGCRFAKEINNPGMGIAMPGGSQQTKGKKKNKKGNKNTEEKQHRCYGCSLFFDKIGSLLEHRPFCENLSWRMEATAFHKCFECDEKFVTKDQLMKHKKITCKGKKWRDGDKLKCHFCFGLFDSLPDMKEHRKSKSCVNVNLTCLNCDTTFQDLQAVKSHRMARECMNPHRKKKR